MTRLYSTVSERYAQSSSEDVLATGTSGPVVVPLARGRALTVEQQTDAARLRVRDPSGAELEIQIRFEPAGPSVCVRAHSLALEASEHIAVRCETFAVEARQKLELRSEGELISQAGANARIEARHVEITAEPGSVRLKANDDVQLLGENVLLNCERPRPMPEWVGERIRVDLTLPPEGQAGDRELIELLSS